MPSASKFLTHEEIFSHHCYLPSFHKWQFFKLSFYNYSVLNTILTTEQSVRNYSTELCFISAATAGAPSNQPHVTFKNKLQEYVQKKKNPMPSYTTVWVTVNGPPGFVCTLNVEGMQYQSDRKQVKKEAEQDAARIALVSLGLVTE